MLKQRLTSLTDEFLVDLCTRVLVALRSSACARHLTVTRLTPVNEHKPPRYTIENGDHVTPPFRLGSYEFEDGRPAPALFLFDASDEGGVTALELDDAAVWLARELAEVA